ncbi:MAG TPA: glycosyltransferase [Pyrinomonadaceae bacterium]|nr:glycosyltransferase [Pyrinomonadaceae bacterium]
MKTLYICYFGLREPLVQTQVLPYLRELNKGGIEVYLLTFEPKQPKGWTPEEIEEWRARLRDEGIRWFSLPYHKRPSAPATLYDIAAGARFAARLARREQIDVLHARAHVPVAMAMLARRLGARCRLVFDIRGLMAEEYADAGIWAENSQPFRAVKRVESAGIRSADQLVVLTRKFRDWLVEQRLKAAEQIEVIPCCVDFSLFGETKPEGGPPPHADRFEVIYAGSVTGLYLLEEMARFFLEVRKCRADAYLRILTTSSRTEAERLLARAGLSAEDYGVGAVGPAEVPHYLERARLGLSFRKPTFSQIAASPTKIPEYLAAGLPVVCNAGIGDTDELLAGEKVGVVLSAFDDESYREAARAALHLAEDLRVRDRSRRVARASFDLAEVGGVGYRNVYRRIEEE